MKELTCLAIFLVISAVAAIAMPAAGFICEYKNKTDIKTTTYECGVSPFGDARVRFNIRYLNYAILFLIFDAETIFLYPLAACAGKVGIFSVIEAFIFLAVLIIGLFLAVKKKFLRWI